jgi:tetratricopeptide (TPR) repeat protein
MRVLSVGPTRELECSVVEFATQEVTFVVRTAVASEDLLAAAVDELSAALTEFFRVRSSGPEFANDLRPWIASRSYNVQAVRAFVQGAMYVFRYLPGEPQRYYQRALEIEPTFVAPRIWRLAPLLQQGKLDEARADLAYLQSIEAKVSPFEQAMIAYAGSLLEMNAAAQARHIEVALRYAPGNRVLLVSLALAQELQGDCKAMLDTIRPLVERRWAYAPLYGQWARCSIQLGLVDEARMTLEASLTLVPPWPEVYAFLEALAMVRNDASNAERYSKLMTARLNELGTPGRTRPLATAYNRVGEYAIRSKAYAEALQLFAKASKFDPSEPEYHDRLAETFERLGRTRESQEERSRAGALRGRGRETGRR